MKNKITILKGLLLVSCIQWNLIYAAPDATPTDNIQQSTSNSKPIVLNKFLQFILPAASGVIITNKINNVNQLYLNGVDSNVIYFTNRPRRITGSMTTDFFLKRWIKPPPRDFVSNPPNAIVTYIDNSEKQRYFIVELLKPQYQESTHILSFTIRPLPGSPLLPVKLDRPAIIMSEVAVCGIIGAWGNLPGEKQYDVECHAKEHE